MPTARALCIGLNSVDPIHYQGWNGTLLACEADAEDMASIAREQGFARATLLLTAQATRASVITEIKDAAAALHAGDLFMITYSGHGGQVPDRDDDEIDDQDETWCLHDGQLIDDELALLWSLFEAGVRLLVFSDSCHSGTATRALLAESGPVVDTTGKRYRAMPRDFALRTYRQNREFYDRIVRSLPTPPPAVRASVRLLSGCQDDQLSQDGTFNGLFTGTMLKVWKNGAFHGTYAEFHKAIVAQMPKDQAPNHYVIGTPNAAYDAQAPFEI